MQIKLQFVCTEILSYLHRFTAQALKHQLHDKLNAGRAVRNMKMYNGQV